MSSLTGHCNRGREARFLCLSQHPLRGSAERRVQTFDCSATDHYPRLSRRRLCDSLKHLVEHWTWHAPQMHVSKLNVETLVQSFTAGRPGLLIGGKAYDSNPLSAELAAEGIELIALHRSNRKKAPTQDGASSGPIGPLEGRAVVLATPEVPLEGDALRLP